MKHYISLLPFTGEFHAILRVLKLELVSKTTQAIWWLPMEERNELR